MKKFLVTVFIIAIFAPLALMAQDTTADPVTFDMALVLSILATGLFGLPVSQIVELVKRTLRWKDGKVYLIAFVVSAVCVSAYLIPLGLFKAGYIIGYTLIVFGEASGLYKMVKKPKPE